MEEEMASEAIGEQFQVFRLEESAETCHTLLKVPKVLSEAFSSPATAEAASSHQGAFNILMADCSGSMHRAWPHVVQGWQEHIQDKLTGVTKIYTFDHRVIMRREGTELRNEDNSSGSTNLTAAVRKIREEVENCLHKCVRIFIVTDGHHNVGSPYPEEEIKKTKVPPGMIVDVFLLGIGSSFPVQYSISMRSLWHTGNANLPSLFWSRLADCSNPDIDEQFMSIGAELGEQVSMKINHPGHILPGLPATPVLHLGEWLYFPDPPDSLPQLQLTVDEEPAKPFKPVVQRLTLNLLLDEVFRQWNSVLIQQHHKKEAVPKETFDLMERIFKHEMSKIDLIIEGNGVKARLARKNNKGFSVKFATLMNQSKTVIGLGEKFADELELAEGILMSTVTAKYDTKNLKRKGHQISDYDNDKREFLKIYNEIKPHILRLQAPTTEECCRITMTSTLQDLQDPGFPSLFDENKYEFLRSMTMTGIPVYAPVRDSSQVNPWTLVVENILVAPFTILSQQAIEAFAGADVDALGDKNKDVLLQQDDEKSRFNVVVPVVPPGAADVLKPLVCSKIYAMLATFCILKNPHIVDYNAHIAALACVWVRSISEYPLSARPTYVCNRLVSIEATARIYMGRPGIMQYITIMLQKPQQALMTESSETFNDHTLKCESLIKPLFYMYLCKDQFSVPQIEQILKLICAEFVGRCLANYEKKQKCPFSDFFAKEMADKVKKDDWLEKNKKGFLEEFKRSAGVLVDKYYTMEDLLAAVKDYVTANVQALNQKVSESITFEINKEKVSLLRSPGSCGNIKWKDFRAWAEEMGLPGEAVNRAFDPSQVFVYVCEGLKFTSSKERLGKEPASFGECDAIVRNHVVKEQCGNLNQEVIPQLNTFVVEQWKEDYLMIHKAVVMPLTKQEVVSAASSRGIAVTADTFSTVYRYNEKVKLLRNACQIPACPFYLVPRRNFNQHMVVERKQGCFPHGLHLVSEEFSKQGVEEVVQQVTSGQHSGRQARPKPPPPKPEELESMKADISKLCSEYNRSKLLL